MSKLTIRAKTTIKTTSGNINLDFTYPKGASIERVVNDITGGEYKQLKSELNKAQDTIAKLADIRHYVTPTVINGNAEYVHVSEISKYINKVVGETVQQDETT